MNISSLRIFTASVAALTVTAGVMVAPAAAAANAAEKKACLSAYDKSQRLKKKANLVEARSQLLLCAKDTCPAFVRQDCTKWYAEVDAATPTVVLEAKGPDGQDAIDVNVFMDGKPLVTQIDGKAVPVNPGVHEFRFEMKNAPAVEMKVVIHEAAKNRHINATFEQNSTTSVKHDPGAPAENTNDAKASSASIDTSSTGSMTLPLVFGGIGLLGIGGFTYFGLSFDGKVSDLDKCKPNCAQEDIDSANKDRTFALISGGVGVVSLGLATYFYLSQGSSDDSKQETSHAGPRFDVVSLPGGGAGVVRGTF